MERIKKYSRPAIIVLSLFLIVSMGRSTLGLLGKDDSIKEEQKKVDALKAEQENLKAIQESVGTQSFVEKEARDKLGMSKAGETILVLPSDEVLKKLSPGFDEEKYLEEETIPTRWLKMFPPLTTIN